MVAETDGSGTRYRPRSSALVTNSRNSQLLPLQTNPERFGAGALRYCCARKLFSRKAEAFKFTAHRPQACCLRAAATTKEAGWAWRIAA